LKLTLKGCYTLIFEFKTDIQIDFGIAIAIDFDFYPSSIKGFALFSFLSSAKYISLRTFYLR